MTALASGKMTVGDAVEVDLAKVRVNVSLRPRSKDCRKMMIDCTSWSWPALFYMGVRKVNGRVCGQWLVSISSQTYTRRECIRR